MNIQLLINIHLFIILLTILPFYNTELVIPFESKLCKANQKNIFLSDYYAQFLYTPIKIGSNKQKLEVALKLNRYITYLIGSNVSNLKSESFNEKNSETYEIVEKKAIKSNADEFFSSIKSTDNIIFGENANFNKFLFYLSQEQFFDETGHIGLKKAPISLDTHLNGDGFIDQLKSKSLIKSQTFYFKYELKDEKELKYKGNLVIGGMPHEIEPSELYNINNYVHSYVDFTELNTRWSIKISSVRYGNQTVTELDSAEFSTTLGLIEAPIKFFSIFGYFFKNNGCFGDYNSENKDYYYMYCKKDVDVSKFQNLVFYTQEKEMTFTLTYKDLFKEIGEYNYFLILFNEDLNEWKFGHIFLKKYTMVFDADKKTIGYYYYQPSNEIITSAYTKFFTAVVIFIIIGVVLTIIIVGLLVYICYFKNKKRKTRANELDEHFDYTSKDDDKQQENNKLGV